MNRTASHSVFNHSGPHSLSTSYANVGPIIKANGAKNGKPTGHREVLLNFFMMTKHSRNKLSVSVLTVGFGNETEVMAFKVSYFNGSCKDQCCISNN